jgi:hypothetical protein
MLNVEIQSIMLNGIVLSVFMLNVYILNVAAPSPLLLCGCVFVEDNSLE